MYVYMVIRSHVLLFSSQLNDTSFFSTSSSQDMKFQAI